MLQTLQNPQGASSCRQFLAANIKTVQQYDAWSHAADERPVDYGTSRFPTRRF